MNSTFKPALFVSPALGQSLNHKLDKHGLLTPVDFKTRDVTTADSAIKEMYVGKPLDAKAFNVQPRSGLGWLNK